MSASAETTDSSFLVFPKLHLEKLLARLNFSRFDGVLNQVLQE